SAEGKHLATCSEDGLARAWELATGRRLLEADHAAPVAHAAFSPDSKLLLTASADRTARAWSLLTGKAHTPPLVHDRAVQRAAFSADGRWLLTAAGPFVRLWDGATGAAVGPALPHESAEGEVTELSLSKSGELVTQAGPGTRWARPLVGDPRPEADLAGLAR